MEEQAIVILITAPSPEVGRKIAELLVGEKLAACVNLLPGIESVYTWQGQTQHDSEVLLLVKTRQSLFATLESAVKGIHPYEVPEIIALPVQWGSTSYLDWIREMTAR
jgi:periplasmic divalent cation tolerance protein